MNRHAALIKRWLPSTHQGSVSGQHLYYYLGEYTFRFNRCEPRSRGMLFCRIMAQAVMAAPLPCPQVVEGKHNL